MKLSMLVAGAVGLGLNVALSSAAQAEVTEVVVTVPENQSMTYAEALKAAGYDSYPGDVPMTKYGKGTLVADQSLVGHRVRPLTVAEGVLRTTDDNSYDAFGTRTSPASQPKVLSGGTIRCEGNGFPLISRGMHIAGEGAEGQGGALVAADGFCQVGSMNYMLDGDTTFFSENSPEGTYLLRGTVLELCGHTLTLKSTDRGHVIPGGNTFRAAGSGTIKVDKSNLIFSTLSTLTKDAGTTLKLVLVNGAGYYAVLPACYPLFDVIDAEAGCTLGCRYSPTAETVEAALKVLKGAPTVRDDITALSISDSFTVRVSELKDGHALTMKGALTFGAKAKLVVEGDMNEMLAAGETTVTIAAAEDGVTGFPAFETTPGTKNWRLAVGEDGKSIVFNYVSPKPEGAIDACAEWMILPGTDQAADNVVKFNAAMASCADNATIFFPAGDYYFAAPLEVGVKTGVTILGEDDASVLHLADETAICVLSAVGANGLTLKEIAFADCTGVAVAASGTTGLTVKGCWYKAIGGAIANVTGTYPISIANGTDSFVRGNRTADRAAYTAHVWLDGGNVLAKSEPDAGFVLCVSRGEIDDFATAFAQSGYSTFADTLNMVKVGEGTLIGTQTQLVGERNIITSIKAIDIDEGTLSLAHADDCCPNKGGEAIRIKDGATLQVDNRNGGFHLVSRTITFVGTGAPGKKGAIVIGPGAATDNYSALSLVLSGDATIYNENESGVAGIFRNIIINTAGHRLTLKAATPESGFKFNLKTMTRNGTGEVLADGVTLDDGGEGTGADEKCIREADSAILLKLANGSTFKPRANAIFSLWKGIEMDASSQILGRTAGIEATIGDWIGCGTLDENIASLTIANSLTVKAADLKAGDHLTVAGALVTRPEVRVTLEDAASLNTLEPGDAQPPFAFAASATSISAKPRRASGCDFAGWSVMDGEDGLSWVFDHSGMTLILR